MLQDAQNGHGPAEQFSLPDACIPITVKFGFSPLLSTLQVTSEAIALHDQVIRANLARYGGYEVTTEGDAFVMAFHDAADAMAWCM